jgi:hypothetical protein
MITWESGNQECQLILFCLNKYCIARGKVHHLRYAALENYFDGDETVKILMIQVELDDTRQNLFVELKPLFIDQ